MPSTFVDDTRTPIFYDTVVDGAEGKKKKKGFVKKKKEPKAAVGLNQPALT